MFLRVLETLFRFMLNCKALLDATRGTMLGMDLKKKGRSTQKPSIHTLG
jgi:hypothetical protein